MVGGAEIETTATTTLVLGLPGDQRPKNSHNRMITGIGTPSSQSRAPRPMSASMFPYAWENAKGYDWFQYAESKTSHQCPVLGIGRLH